MLTYPAQKRLAKIWLGKNEELEKYKYKCSLKNCHLWLFQQLVESADLVGTLPLYYLVSAGRLFPHKKMPEPAQPLHPERSFCKRKHGTDERERTEVPNKPHRKQ